MASVLSVQKDFHYSKIIKKLSYVSSKDTPVILLFMFKSLSQLDLCLIVTLDYSWAYVCLDVGCWKPPVARVGWA